jgi:hypothetical protein
MLKLYRNIFFIVSVVLLVTSCRDNFTGTDYNSSKIVVDGSIEVGGYAHVILTNSLSLNQKIDSSSYLHLVNTHAKITISDGTTKEILTLTKDNNVFPPHYYTTLKMKGEVGKTYWLEVIVDGDTIRSKTSIPNGISLDSIWLEPDASDTTRRFIWLKMCDNGAEKNFYRSFTRIMGKQKEFIPTYLSAFNDKLINGTCPEIVLYKGAENFTDKSTVYSYSKTDTVLLKVSTIDETSYNFWKNYEKEVFNSGNPFAGNGSNLTSNVTGGLGIWCGYNSKVYTVIVR